MKKLYESFLLSNHSSSLIPRPPPGPIYHLGYIPGLSLLRGVHFYIFLPLPLYLLKAMDPGITLDQREEIYVYPSWGRSQHQQKREDGRK